MMKKILSLSLALVILLQLCACQATSTDSSSDSSETNLPDETISILPNEGSEVDQQSQSELADVTVLSEQEAIAYVDGFISYVSDFVHDYTEFLDNADDNISYSDIEDFENFWKEKSDETNERVEKLQLIAFPEKYKDEYVTVYNIAETLDTISKDLGDWDTNSDGAYTSDEVNALIKKCSDNLRNIPVEDLRDMIENGATEDDGEGNSQILEDQERPQSTSKNIKTCEVCGKTGSFELVGFTGATEYYCYEHYKEMKDIADRILGKGESSSSSRTPTDTKTTPTKGEENALKSAQSYLNVMAFSYSGLISQLEYEGYSHSEAVYGADHCGADWNEQAAKSAANYLEIMSFSRSGLIEQLEFEGFTHTQAVYGVEQNGY